MSLAWTLALLVVGLALTGLARWQETRPARAGRGAPVPGRPGHGGGRDAQRACRRASGQPADRHPAEGSLYALSGQVPCIGCRLPECGSIATSRKRCASGAYPRARHGLRSRRMRCLVRKSPIREWTDPVLSLVDWFPPRWRQLVATVLVACGVTLAAWPAAARSALDLSQLDLRLNPADVAPEPPPLVPRRAGATQHARTERAGDRGRRRSGQADRDPQQTGRGHGPPGQPHRPTMGCSRSCSRTRRSRCFGCG